MPSGAIVLFLAHQLHTDENYWGKDAKEFKPERFAKENAKNIEHCAYIPFSKGPRACPGRKYAMNVVKTFLSRFLMKYRVSTDLKYDELKFQFFLTIMVKQGFMMKVERR